MAESLDQQVLPEEVVAEVANPVDRSINCEQAMNFMDYARDYKGEAKLWDDMIVSFRIHGKEIRKYLEEHD